MDARQPRKSNLVPWAPLLHLLKWLYLYLQYSMVNTGTKQDFSRHILYLSSRTELRDCLLLIAYSGTLYNQQFITGT